MQQNQQIFRDSVIREFKYNKVVKTIGRDVLHACVLSCCTDTIEDIAEKCKDGKLEIKRSNGKKIKLNVYGPEKIKAREDPSGLSFDITFLAKILSLIEAEYPSFYKKIKAVKDARNEVCHNDSPLDKVDYDTRLTEFEKLINDILKEAERVSPKQKSQVSCQKNLDEISDGSLQIQTWKSDLSQRIEKIKSEHIVESDAASVDYIKIKGQKEIIKSYDNLIFMNPVDFFIGTKHKHLVSEFYTELKFHDKDEDRRISQYNVFKMSESGNSNVIIEGNSGIGKTTLIKKIMAQKKDMTTNETLLIHINCRNVCFSSLEDHIAYVMPKAKTIFSNKEKLTSAILLLKPVFLVDGLDELNHNSNKILDDIIAYVKRNDATIFATSRPEGVKQFLSRMAGTETKYLEIRGIPEERQQETIEKYMKIFSPTTSAPSLEEVTVKLDELRESLGTYMRVPLIICLLVYLILNTKEIHSKSTLSEVYNAITDSLLDKLKSRIITSSDPLSDLEREFRVDEFFSYVCEASFKSLKMGELILKRDTATEIAKRTDTIFGRIREDVMSSIFVCRGSITETGHEKTYSFPHKSFQEFWAAKYIEKAFINDKSARLWELLGIPKSNVLLFTIGILVLNDRLRSDICEDVVKILYEEDDLFSCLECPSSQILRESKGHPLMLKAMLNISDELELDQRFLDLEVIQKIFEEEYPQLITVFLRFVLQSNEPSSSIVNILLILKKKNFKIDLQFLSDEYLISKYHCDAYIRALHGGRSRLTLFEGCLGEEGINLLPDVLDVLNLYIISEREALGLQRLCNNGKMLLSELTLNIISRKFDAHLLPKKIPIPSGYLKVNFFDVGKDDLPWVLEVMDRLPRTSDPECEDIRIALVKFMSEDEDAVIQFVEELKGKSFQKMRIIFGKLDSELLTKHLKSLEEEGIIIE